MSIFLKKAILKDNSFIYDLKSSREVKESSINKKKIELKNHNKWLKNKLADKKTLFFIIIEKKYKLKVGYVRLDFENFYYRVTIAVIKSKTRRKYASKALKLVEKKINLNSILFAQVMSFNFKSIKLFKKAGYKLAGSRKKIKFFVKFSGKQQ